MVLSIIMQMSSRFNLPITLSIIIFSINIFICWTQEIDEDKKNPYLSNSVENFDENVDEESAQKNLEIQYAFPTKNNPCKKGYTRIDNNCKLVLPLVNFTKVLQ